MLHYRNLYGVTAMSTNAIVILYFKRFCHSRYYLLCRFFKSEALIEVEFITDKPISVGIAKIQ
ncbi:hypothetical protein [Nitrosomonas sp. Nm166]|uniref:hypothetical protein n=1 Tax=Nitrosomonas sp. Nm166 TaxID=1881054 RepID=UPI0008E5D336|nr:hypothetical protein [Nitrosomonas sp. Nm166]SFE15765.1 hypothetical protein SAMN05428977_100819 [Nitrosomonas sp. Nm166]